MFMRFDIRMAVSFLLIGGGFLGSLSTATAGVNPVDSFRNPPDDARPWVYWFWKNGNIRREGITADLEAMAQQGIGGVILMEVSLSVPPGDVKFFDPQWRELLRFAASEADRLGLKMDLNSGPGWTGSGGAWVTPEQSMKKVVASETTVTGPAHVVQKLEQPETVCDFYRDIAVLAFPTPANSYAIADIKEKALYTRGAFSSQPGVRAAFAGVADYGSAPADSMLASGQMVELSTQMAADGTLTWDVPQGSWTVLRFGYTSTGQTNRPSPLPGLECDKMDPAALDAHFEHFITSLLQDMGPLGGKVMVAMHLDSWEVGAQNWTARFREEFQKRRGYDLLRFLPTMLGKPVDSLETSERFLWDLRQTASGIVVEFHGKRMEKLAQDSGLWLSIEPYDMMPCDDMTFGATADVPMCEFWSNTFDTKYSVREASSIGHVYGKNLIAAEAFTSIDRWLLHPGAIKTNGDWAFSEGVNRMVIHRYIHQPFMQIQPGLSLGPHGLHYERTQTWWKYSRPWHEYLARCQQMLRQGQAVADLLYLSPEGAPNVFQSPDPAPRGHKLDGCTPEALKTRMRAENGMLTTPEGMRYRMLVLPKSETMTPELLACIKGLAAAGVPVVGAPPKASPSLSNYPACDERVRQLAAAAWSGSNPVLWNEALAGAAEKPTLYPASDLITAQLSRMGVPADFESETPLRFAHRRDGEREIYFVSNGENQRVDTVCSFRVADKSPQLWHPEDGSVRPLPEYSAQVGGRTSVPLRFEAGESYFVVFSGKVGYVGVNWHEYTPVAPVAGPWTVSFDPALGGPKEPVVFGALDDWATRPEKEIQYYSGTAVYKTTFDLSAETVGSKGRLLLDLGRVEVMADVTLNGNKLGILWKTPYRIDMTGAAQAGSNTLEVAVVNLWPNRLIGDEQLPPDSDRNDNGTLKQWPSWLLEGKTSPTGRYTFATWRHWKQDDALLPSGLMGPVGIVREEMIRVR